MVAWHPFDSVKGTREILCAHLTLFGHAPCCGFQLFSIERAGNAFSVCSSLQACDPLALVGSVLRTDPVGVCVPHSSLAERPKEAFGGAFEESLYKIGGNSHIHQPTRWLFRGSSPRLIHIGCGLVAGRPWRRWREGVMVRNPPLLLPN